MDVESYDRQRQDIEAGAHRPSDMLVDPGNIDAGLTVRLSLEHYPKLAGIFETLADGAEPITLHDYSWKSLAPPLDHFSHERPVMLRLDLAFKIPVEFRLPLLFKIETYHDIAYLSTIAESGRLVITLTDAPASLDAIALPLCVAWPELSGMIHALVDTGIIHLP